MYVFFRKVGLKGIMYGQVPAVFLSLFVAETLYKFGSFTLEVAAFLATWFVLDAAFHGVRGLLKTDVADEGV